MSTLSVNNKPQASNSGSLPLHELALVAQSPEEQIWLAQEAIKKAREHPGYLAPLCFNIDQMLDGVPIPMYPEPFHWEWLDAALEYDEIMLIAARGHAKSEYYSGVLPAWMLGKNPRLRFVHITSTDPLAMMYSRRLQEVVTSDEFRMVFPDFPGKGSKWSDSEWQLDVPGQRDPTWRCAGRGGSITGGRADVIIVDDIVTLKNSRTPGERQQTWEWWKNTLVPMLVPNQSKLLVIGTRYHEEDLYSTLEQGGMETLLYPAEKTKEGKRILLWPGRWTPEALDERKVPPKGSDSSYAAQYLCTPVSARQLVFKEWMFEIVGAEEIPAIPELWWVWDGAVTKKTSADYTAGVLGGLGKENNLTYILNALRGQWEPGVAKQKIIQAFMLSRAVYGKAVRGILVEETKEGKVFRDWFREVAKEMPVILVPHGGLDKFTRASEVLPYCQAENVKFKEGPWVEDLLDELKAFTPDDSHTHDDWVDALVYLLKYLYEPKFELLIGRAQ